MPLYLLFLIFLLLQTGVRGRSAVGASKIAPTALLSPHHEMKFDRLLLAGTIEGLV